MGRWEALGHGRAGSKHRWFTNEGRQATLTLSPGSENGREAYNSQQQLPQQRLAPTSHSGLISDTTRMYSLVVSTAQYIKRGQNAGRGGGGGGG